MGFTCYICTRPFDEIVEGLKRGNEEVLLGNGERPVSAIVKCGHIFHSPCLKKALDSQSANAWVQKKCPVCGVNTGIQDVIRVYACLSDLGPSQREREEALHASIKQLKQEKEAALRDLEMSQSKFVYTLTQSDLMRQQKDDLSNRMEQSGRIVQTLRDEIGRKKALNERLRDIIVCLSGKLTGIDRELVNEMLDNSPLAMQNMVVGGIAPRLDIGDDFERFTLRDAYPESKEMYLETATMTKKGNNHPPGFQFPLQENIADYHQAVLRPNQWGGESSGILGDCYGFQPVNGFSEGLLRSYAENMEPVLSESSSRQQNGGYETNNNTGNNSSAAGRLSDQNPSPLTAANDDNIHVPFQRPGQSSVATVSPPTWIEVHSVNGTNETENGADSQECWKKPRRRSNGKSGSGRGPVREERNVRNAKEGQGRDGKLYGQFLCTSCGAEWGSSQSFLNTPQTCRVCKTIVHPHDQGPILSRRQLEADGQEVFYKKKK